MRYVRPVDKKATKVARARQERGIAVLDRIFGYDQAQAVGLAELASADYLPEERARRRKRTKAQRVARRANRR